MKMKNAEQHVEVYFPVTHALQEGTSQTAAGSTRMEVGVS
jgi:hypothetical protein